MEEIQWHGPIMDASKDVGKLAQLTGELMSNKTLPDHGLRFPYTYIYSIEDADRITDDSVNWPISLKASFGEQVFSPTLVIHNYDEFRSTLEQIKIVAPTSVILISLPIKTGIGPHRSYHATTAFYLSRDYIMLYNTRTSRAFTIHSDNFGVFHTLGLKSNFVYRIVNTSDGWFIENIISYDDPSLNGVLDNTISDLPSKEFLSKEFTRGYRNGFHESFEISIRLKSLGSFSIGDAYDSGFIIAGAIKGSLYSIMNSAGISPDLTSGSLINKASLATLKAFAGKNKFEEFISLIKLHNILMDDLDQDSARTIEEGVLAICKGHGSDFGILMDQMSQIAHTLWSYGDQRPDKNSDSIFKIENIPEDVEFSIDIAIDFEMAQIRILEQNSSSLSMRFQTRGLRVKTFATVDSETQIISNVNPNGVELQFVIKPDDLPPESFSGMQDFVNKFSALNHSGKSTANTGVVYVPLKMGDDYFESVENGMPILPKSTFLEYASNVGWTQIPADI